MYIGAAHTRRDGGGHGSNMISKHNNNYLKPEFARNSFQGLGCLSIPAGAQKRQHQHTACSRATAETIMTMFGATLEKEAKSINRHEKILGPRHVYTHIYM